MYGRIVRSTLYTSEAMKDAIDDIVAVLTGTTDVNSLSSTCNKNDTFIYGTSHLNSTVLASWNDYRGYYHKKIKITDRYGYSYFLVLKHTSAGGIELNFTDYLNSSTGADYTSYRFTLPLDISNIEFWCSDSGSFALFSKSENSMISALTYKRSNQLSDSPYNNTNLLSHYINLSTNVSRFYVYKAMDFRNGNLFSGLTTLYCTGTVTAPNSNSVKYNKTGWYLPETGSGVKKFVIPKLGVMFNVDSNTNFYVDEFDDDIRSVHGINYNNGDTITDGTNSWYIFKDYAFPLI